MNDPTIQFAGWATKRGTMKKSWKRRYFVLRTQTHAMTQVKTYALLYYREPRGELKGTIDLGDDVVDIKLGARTSTDIVWPHDAGKQARFEVVTTKRTFHIYCNKPQDAYAWVQELRTCIGLKPLSMSHPSSQLNNSAAQQAEAERHQQLLALLKGPNSVCADCRSPGPTWTSTNLGVFLCLTCAGIHRGLGVHISKIKSIKLDKWTPDQISQLASKGNKAGNETFEALLPEGYKRPDSSDVPGLEKFIRTKYVKHQWMARQADEMLQVAEAAISSKQPLPSADFEVDGEMDVDENSIMRMLHRESAEVVAEHDPMATHSWT